MRAKVWSEAVRILVINPNSTAAMTEQIGVAAQTAASRGTEIVAVNPLDGPASIEGAEDGEAALPGLFGLFNDMVITEGGYHAAIIACFDDTGLLELRERSPIPVSGIGEAGYLAAMDHAATFSVVTTLEISVPVLEANLAAYGMIERCVRVRASGVPVLALENDLSSLPKLEAEIEAAITEDDVGAVVLGCAGMSSFSHAMQSKYAVPIIDGVEAAVRWCEQRVGR
ncbi:MAG: aspartate/glutamate racemase family protein [Pseudomonadota bacterium]